MASIGDTSFVVSVAIESDHYHKACLTVYREEREIYLLQPALAEIAYLLRRERGNEMVARFLAGLRTSKYKVLSLEEADIDRIAELLRQYADSCIDLVDASVIAVAERLEITRILTLDQRDFRIVRPRHSQYFELLPQP